MIANDKKGFATLKVWELAHQLVLQVYKITSNYPANEKFRLTDQLCRSASSIASNIVEGNSRGHIKEYLQFVNTAYASLQETRYHLLLSKDLRYLTVTEYEKLEEKSVEIGKMLNSLKTYLRSKI